MPAFHNVICSLLLDTAKTAYELGMQKMQMARHATAIQTAYEAHLRNNCTTLKAMGFLFVVKRKL